MYAWCKQDSIRAKVFVKIIQMLHFANLAEAFLNSRAQFVPCSNYHDDGKTIILL